jgi:hypothetical protein
VVLYRQTDRYDEANCCFSTCFTNVPKVKECDFMCLFCYRRGTTCSCPTHVVAEQQSSSGHTLSYIRNCIWHDKSSRFLLRKVFTNYSKKCSVFSLFHVCVTLLLVLSLVHNNG